MATKKKKKMLQEYSKTPSTNKIVMTDFSSLSLKKFNSKPHFEIVFIVPQTPQDYTFLDQLVETGKKYEYLSNTIFVSYEDVVNLMERAVDKQVLSLPKYLIQYAENMIDELQRELISFQETQSTSVDTLAKMTKLAIIESMYKTYTSEVTNMQRRQQLHEQLSKLAKDTGHKDKKEKKGKKGKKGSRKSSKSKKSKKSKKTKSTKSGNKKSKKSSKDKKSGKTKTTKKSKKSKKTASTAVTAVGEETVDDYTEIVLEENELLRDYNVDNHVTYIVLSGFCPLLLKELAKINVYVSSVIEVALESSDLKSVDDWVTEVREMFADLDNQYLENTVLMHYRGTAEDMKETLEEFIYVVRRINHTKRQHLRYIKDLKLHDFGVVPNRIDPECLEKYNRILDEYPPELVTIPVIVDALVQEICWRELGPIYSLSDLSTNSSAVFEEPETSDKSYQVHEKDLLNMVLNSYKIVGRKFYDKSLEYLNHMKPLEKFDDPSMMTTRRTRGISTEDHCYCTHIEDFYNYFHLAIFAQMRRQPFVPRNIEDYDFITNLATYDEVKTYQDVLPKGTTNDSIDENDLFRNYHMKEDLSTSVVRQLIFDALEQYSCWDRVYCELTNSILLRFHDNLNEFGIETHFWNKSLRTPVCLRDFCKYMTVEDKNWVQQHVLKKHAELVEDEESEECEGLGALNVPELYQEYQYLLGVPTGTTDEWKSILFDEVKEELITYPRSDTLTTYCNSEHASLVAYDLGPKRVQLTGHTTVFHSDDSVKVTIDASRFLLDEPKCSINISAEEHNFVFHSTATSFRAILKSGILVNFIKLEDEEEIVPLTPTEEETVPLTPTDEETEVYDEETRQVSKQSLKQSEDKLLEPKSTANHWVQLLRKCKLPTVLNNVDPCENAVQLDDENMDMVLDLFKAALDVQHPIYKISKRASLQCLIRTNSPTMVPLTSILNRIFFKPKPKKRIMRGYRVVLKPHKVCEVPLQYDFTLTLPNGLFVTTLAGQGPVTEVKQAYKFCRGKERYRVFYATGTILVKNTDGSTTIYRSNGDIIYLTDQSESTCTDCPKNIKEIFKSGEDEICPYKLSRCESTLRVLNEVDFYSLCEFEGIPYTRKTVLDFTGKEIRVFEGKVTEQQVYYGVNENNYYADETMFDREDGFRCVTYHTGKQLLQFPDGTTMSAWAVMEKELIFVGNPNKAEGWVSVIIHYQYEHPDYLSVLYNPTEGHTQLVLADAVVKRTADSFIMSVDNIVVDVTGENFTLLKTCPMCDGDCICKIYMKEPGKFFEICDSSGKYLTCDRTGACEISKKYIKVSNNKHKCDHRWQNEKQKMFILNERGAPGTLFWKDSTVEQALQRAQYNKNLSISNYMNPITKKQTIEIFEEVCQNFRDRFIVASQRKINLSKNKTDQERQVRYVKFRFLEDFRNFGNDKQACELLLDYLESFGGGIAALLLSGIKKLKQFNNEKEEVTLNYRQSMVDYDRKVSVSTNDSSNKRIEDVIEEWRRKCEEYRHLIRNKIFKPYFHSDYYQQVLSTLKSG